MRKGSAYPCLSEFAANAAHKDNNSSELNEYSTLKSLIFCLFIIFIVVGFIFPPYILDWLGWFYYKPSLNTISALHPETYIICIIYIITIINYKNPLLKLKTDVFFDTRIFLYILSMIIFLIFIFSVQETAFQKLPILLDNYFAPLIMVLVYLDLPARHRNAIKPLFHVLMLANAIIGLGEFNFGQLRDAIGENAIDEIWRASALLGHPLWNALITSCYIIGLMLGGDINLNKNKRIFIIFTQIIAMISFGGRFSTVSIIIFTITYFIYFVFFFIIGNKINIIYTIRSILFFIFMIVIFCLIYHFNGLNLFLNRFYDDNGSAAARIKIIDLIEQTNIIDILFGQKHDSLSHIININGLEYGIENFIFGHIFEFGFIPTLFLMIGFYLFLNYLYNTCNKKSIFLIVNFIFGNLTMVGMSSKFEIVCIFILMVLVLFDKNAGPFNQKITQSLSAPHLR